MSDFDSQLAEIKRGARQYSSRPSFCASCRGAAAARQGGLRSDAPNLHLGHTVLLNKNAPVPAARARVVFLIGDFTGLIGDPSGRNATRPALTPPRLRRTLSLIRSSVQDPGPGAHGRGLQLPLVRRDARRASSKSPASTTSHGCSRDDFSQRHKKGESIGCTNSSILVQDKTRWRCGRMLSSAARIRSSISSWAGICRRPFGQEPQIVLTMPLLEGLDGVNKMSKSSALRRHCRPS